LLVRNGKQRWKEEGGVEVELKSGSVEMRVSFELYNLIHSSSRYSYRLGS